MKAVWLVTLLVLGFMSFTVVAEMDHSMHGSESKGSEHKMADSDSSECEKCKTSGEMCEACKLKKAHAKKAVCEKCKVSGEMCEACKLKKAHAKKAACEKCKVSGEMCEACKLKKAHAKKAVCEKCKVSGEMCEACKLKKAHAEKAVCEKCKVSGEMCEACKLKMAEHKGSEMKGSMHKHDATGDQARCALDGMKMKASAMLQHGEGGMYFCNEAHHEMFMKDPKRYLKTVRIGEHKAAMHVLTVKEYKGMMESMGMGKMAKVENPNATHYLSVHFAEEVPVEIAGIVAKVVAADGQVSFHELAYDKMMKSHTGNISLLKAGKHKISLLFASSEVEL